MSLRRNLLSTARAVGAFALARAFTRSGLRILCYHGISLADEHAFYPKLFMREETFRRRLDYLKRNGYPVLALDEAIACLDKGLLPAWAVVITFDDGWVGTGTLAAPAMRESGFPSTLYVTTGDVEDRVPVFNVALQWLLWRGCNGNVDLDLEGMELQAGPLPLGRTAERERATLLIGEAANKRDAAGRTALLKEIAGRLGIDWESVERASLFRLMTPEQLAVLPGLGMDLQLHTHTHRLPRDDRRRVEAEISNNRASVARVSDRRLTHFCYPSGEYHPTHFGWLRELGIVSATTCRSGFNYKDTERMELGRFLDGENISQVEFEAELTGFMEIMRRLRALLSKRAQGAGKC